MNINQLWSISNFRLLAKKQVVCASTHLARYFGFWNVNRTRKNGICHKIRKTAIISIACCVVQSTERHDFFPFVSFALFVRIVGCKEHLRLSVGNNQYCSHLYSGVVRKISWGFVPINNWSHFVPWIDDGLMKRNTLYDLEPSK